MGKIISCFQKTDKRNFIDCRITATRDYLNYYGYNLSSYDLFILGETIDFIIYGFKIHEKSGIKIWLAGGTRLEYEKVLLNKLDINFEVKAFSNDVFNEIKYNIDNDIPLIVFIDIRYAKGLNPQSMLNGKFDIHCISSTVVAGYDSDRKTIFLDFKDKNSTSLVEVSFDNFLMGIQSNCFPIPVEQKYILPVIDSHKINTVEQYSVKIKTSLRNISRRMLSGGSSVLLELSNNVDVAVGLPAIEKLIKLNNEFMESLSLEDVDVNVANKLFLMKFRALREELLPGSNHCYRKEFGVSLINVSENLKDKKLKTIGKEFVKISSQWRAFIRYLYQADKMVNRKSEFIRNVVKKLEYLYQKEKELFIAIDSMCVI